MTKASVYTILFDEVIRDESSPYKQMIKKLDDIEKVYFEKDPQWAEQPPTKSDFQIKKVVLKDIDKLAKKTLNRKLKVKLYGILQEGQNEISDVEWSVRSLVSTTRAAYEYYGQIEPCPKIDQFLLQSLYKKAVDALPKEGNGQGNIGFNKGFHHALLHNTIWESKELIEQRIIQFIEEVITIVVTAYKTTIIQSGINVKLYIKNERCTSNYFLTKQFPCAPRVGEFVFADWDSVKMEIINNDDLLDYCEFLPRELAEWYLNPKLQKTKPKPTMEELWEGLCFEDLGKVESVMWSTRDGLAVCEVYIERM